jgi:hypothetical protein
MQILLRKYKIIIIIIISHHNVPTAGAQAFLIENGP